MKKFTLLMSGLMLASVAVAQDIPATFTDMPAPLINKAPYSTAKSAATNNFWIDYDYYEENLFGAATASPGTGYRRVYTLANQNFVKTGIHYGVLAVDSIHDTNNDIVYAKSSYDSLRVDTVYLAIGHVNRSGTNDTLTIKLIGLNSAGYPVPSNVFATEQIITNTSLSPTDSPLDFFTQAIAFKKVLPNNAKQFGVLFEYRGDTLDTLTQLFGFYDQGGPCGQASYKPAKSLFSVNTYVEVSRYASYGTLPTATGANLYFDCDGNGTKDPTDGESSYQNMAIWVNVTTDPLESSVNEQTTISGISVFPNPAKDVVNFNYNLAAAGTTTLKVFDITGKEVLTSRHSNVAGKNQLQVELSKIENGLYFYQIENGSETASGKFTVVK